MPEDKKKRDARLNKWKADNKDRINVLFPKGTRERITSAADYVGESSSEYVRKAVEQRLSETENEMEKS